MVATRDNLYDPRAPSTLHKIVHLRIERLGGDSRRVLQSASIIGTVFDYKLLRELLGPVSKKLLDVRLKELERFDFILEKSKFPKRTFQFRNQSIQRIIYDSIPLNKKVKSHGEIASYIEALNKDPDEKAVFLMAHHYMRSDRTVQAIKYSFLLGKILFEKYQLMRALDVFIKTFDLIDTCDFSHEYLEMKKEIYEFKWEIYLLLGRYDLSLSSLNSLRALLAEDDFKGALDIKRMLAEVLVEKGDFKKAEEMLYEVIDICRSKNLNKILVGSLKALTFINIFKEKIEVTKELCEEGLFLCTEEDIKLKCHFFIYLGFAEYYQNKYTNALAYFNKALDQLKQKEDRALLGKVKCNIGMIYFKKGQFEEALEYYSQSLEILSGIEYQRATSITRMNLAVLYDHLGNYRKALYEYGVVLKIAEEIANLRLLMMVLGNKGEVYTRLGEYKLSQKYLKEALEFADRIGSKFWKMAVLLNLGINYSATGNRSQAKVSFEEAFEIAKNLGEKEKELEAKLELIKIEADKSIALEKARALQYEIIENRQLGKSEGLKVKIKLLTGSLEAREGDKRRARDYLEEAFKSAFTANNSEWIFACSSNLAIFYDSIGETRLARNYIKKAKKYLNELTLLIPRDNRKTFLNRKVIHEFNNLYAKYGMRENSTKGVNDEFSQKHY